MVGIVENARQRIGEYSQRFVEADDVFLEMGRGLRVVPFEPAITNEPRAFWGQRASAPFDVSLRGLFGEHFLQRLQDVCRRGD